MCKLVRNPSQELQLAAIFHDIDRVVTPGVGGGFKGDRKSIAYENYKKSHARRSAGYIIPLLTKEGISTKSLKRVAFLISHHDDTGNEVEELNDKELNILVAADSLSFFSSIAPKLYEKEGEARLKDKVRFMIEKMPKFARELLASQTLENTLFDKIKNEILAELN